MRGRGRASQGRGNTQPQPGSSRQEPAQPESQASQRPGQMAAQTNPRGRGLRRVTEKPETAAASLGRGFEKMSVQSGGGGDPTATAGAAAAVVTTGRGATRGRRILPVDILVTKPSHIMNKKGSSGSSIMIKSNYFKLLTIPDWCIYQYHVDFTPEEDRTIVRKGLLRIHKEKIGTYIFDGTLLYTSNRFNDMELASKRQSDDAHIIINIRAVGSLSQGDSHYIQFFNIIMRKCLGFLKLQLIGRNYFDPKEKVCLPEYKLELWPGYVTSIRQHETDILLCAEITHKVMRQETIYDILQNCLQQNRNRWKDTFISTVVGTVVMTYYNNNTYRIEDIDFDATPQSTFPMKDGSMISYMEYYAKKYGFKINHSTQPLLLAKSRSKDRQASKGGPVYLIPEFCSTTGLTDQMRDDFQVMKSLATYTRVNPATRIQKLLAFNSRLQNVPDVSKELSQWNFKLDRNLLEFPARVLNNEEIRFGGNAYITCKNGDWTREMQNKRLLVADRLKNWIIIVSDRNQQNAQSFVNTLLKVSKGISFFVDQPKVCIIRDDRPSGYSEFLEEILSKYTPQLVFCVVANNRIDRYSAIKRKCCVDRPVPSQVYLQKNLTHKNVMSIATKVAIQMNCKMGGAPWHVHVPLDGLMVVGFDVSHDTTRPNKDIGALVASLDSNFTKYFSATDLHADGNELSFELATNICKAAMAYRGQNNALPKRILIYRDGVGEGQVHQVMEHEVVELRKKLNELYGGELYRMSFVIVTKRLNTRFFYSNDNPPTGTIIDDFVTSPIKYDFFIVSQKVREGSVTPTSYSVIYDNLGLDPDKMQRLTYKLTHMYFNCSNTVRVPAPCHYAHKLAFLVSKFIHALPTTQLQKSLYFL